MSIDCPATFIAIVNSTRELPASTVFVAALAAGSSESTSPPQAVRPTASRTSWRERRTRLTRKSSKQIRPRRRLTRTRDSRGRLVSSTNETMPRHEDDGLVEARALAKQLAENHEWLDADELEDDELFGRLVTLLCNPGRVRDDAFAIAARDGSKFLRAGTLVAIANGRKPPGEWAERAKKRFARAEWGERMLLLRALGAVPNRCILSILECADADWSGSPLAAAVSEFLDARVARGERLTAAELVTLDAGLQTARRRAARRRHAGDADRARARGRPVAATVDRHELLRGARPGRADRGPPRGHAGRLSRRRRRRGRLRTLPAQPSLGAARRRAGRGQDDAGRGSPAAAGAAVVRVPGGGDRGDGRAGLHRRARGARAARSSAA